MSFSDVYSANPLYSQFFVWIKSEMVFPASALDGFNPLTLVMFKIEMR